jgi:DNA processing protein
MARELAAAGIVVVSGLARGIDTAAHQGAIEGGGATVAVVAGGADVPYPEENAALMATIAGREGAVVSERPPGAVPRARDFPRRNRIIAGLSMGVVVVEAAPQSGSLITARLAAEQGREVMAVPGSPLDPRHRGTNQLLREGATLVETAADVAEAIRPLLSLEPLRSVTRSEVHAIRSAPPAEQATRGRSERRQRGSSAAPAALPPPALGSLDRLLGCLGPEPVAVDELVRQCQASVAAVQELLLDLELEGRVERHPGNRVSLRPG